MSKGLEAVTLESNCLNDPAAAFLALANSFSPVISLSSFNFSKSAVDKKTSHLTVMFIFYFNLCVIDFIVITFRVTSSPTFPSPRVAP